MPLLSLQCWCSNSKVTCSLQPRIQFDIMSVKCRYLKATKLVDFLGAQIINMFLSKAFLFSSPTILDPVLAIPES